MRLHRIKKGLDLPIAGAPEQTIHDGAPVAHVAIVAADYVGMRPTMHAAVGETVKRGQVLFEDKKNPGVLYTSPGAGTVKAVHRGERRSLESVVIQLNEREQAGNPRKSDFAAFENFTGQAIAGLTRDALGALLVESGLWTAFRTRPFNKIPAPGSVPHSIFVTAMDTNPLAPAVEPIVAEREDDFRLGLLCLVKLTDGPVYLCKAPGSSVKADPNSGVFVEEFAGPHPAGLPGLHIHLVDPVHRGKTVWHIGYQDVIAVGALVRSGKLEVARVVALAGPGVKQPRLLRTRIGASTDELAAGELVERSGRNASSTGELRVISGSVLSGRAAMGEIHGYVGRYHNQIGVIAEERERVLLGWMSPGANVFSVVNAFLSCLFPSKKFAFTTTLNGAPRAMVPLGLYEKVMPMDLMPTFLLRALIMDDIERAEELGCLELDEEDLALCTFVCPGKYEYGPILRRNLAIIEKEG